MSQSGLTYDQGPPFGAPLRLFLVAPLFLLLAAAAAIPLAPEWTANRWSPAALALTHLLTLGFLGPVMVGSLLQMLPVIIGIPVPAVSAVSHASLWGLGAGTLLLAGGLAWMEPALIEVGIVALLAGWLPLLAAAGLSLARTRMATQVLAPMRKAWLALALTVALGTYLAGGLAGWWPVGDIETITGVHAAWGLLGWVLMLIAGVAYHVVPMLQLTPAYPEWVSRWLGWVLLAGLALFSLGFVLIGGLLATLAALVFAFATLDIQRRRRRKLPDVTLGFWRLGLASLIASAVALPLARWLPEPWQGRVQLAVGIAFLLGFAVSIVHGMLYKIVPFLAWFHLQTQTKARAGTIPNMKEYVPDDRARLHLRLHAGAVLLLLPAPFLPPAASAPGLILLAASAQLLWLNLVRARRRFLFYGGRLN